MCQLQSKLTVKYAKAFADLCPSIAQPRALPLDLAGVTVRVASWLISFSHIYNVRARNRGQNWQTLRPHHPPPTILDLTRPFLTLCCDHFFVFLTLWYSSGPWDSISYILGSIKIILFIIALRWPVSADEESTVISRLRQHENAWSLRVCGCVFYLEMSPGVPSQIA